MDATHLILLFLAIGVIAFLYSSVGHAGASGYIATMTLFGIAPTVIRPTALVLNILVASIGAFQFWRAGHFSWQLFWPFALLSIPAAYVGGYLQPSASVLRILIGIVLLFSAARLLFGRAYWDRWRNISHAAAAVLSMGAHSPGRCRVGTLHLGKFNSRTSWLFHESSFHPFARADSCSGCNHWRRHRLASGEQTFRCSSDFGISGDSASYRRNKTGFDEVGRLTSIANV